MFDDKPLEVLFQVALLTGARGHSSLLGSPALSRHLAEPVLAQGGQCLLGVLAGHEGI